ncbi:MAG: hypothetical protein LIP01_05490 [Tannerellaceae bacterium]|nr:hypothetical protein [Tannerellaceae bacterium]
MTNLEALSAKCTLICSEFYPDDKVLRNMLFDNGIEPNGRAMPKDAVITKQAIILVKGFVASSRSENGVSFSVNEKAVEDNIRFWCGECGLDASEFVKIRSIRNGSKRW